MTNYLFIKLVVSFITLMWALITVMVVPYIQTKITASQMEKLNWYIQTAVRCAEQIYTVEQWREKKKYVMDKALKFLNDTLHLTLSEEDVDLIVEGVVNEIKKN